MVFFVDHHADRVPVIHQGPAVRPGGGMLRADQVAVYQGRLVGVGQIADFHGAQGGMALFPVAGDGQHFARHSLQFGFDARPGNGSSAQVAGEPRAGGQHDFGVPAGLADPGGQERPRPAAA